MSRSREWVRGSVIVAHCYLLTFAVVTAANFGVAASTIGPPPPGAASACTASPLGVASDANVFVTEDLAQRGTRIAGRVVVGGRATLTDVSVGASLAPSPPRDDTLIVGDALDFRGGAVNGDAVSEGLGTLANVAFAGGGSYRRGAALYRVFTARADLHALSDAYAALPDTATTRTEYGQVILVGEALGLNVFTVSGSDLSTANSLAVRVPPGATVLVNVTGVKGRMRNMGFALSGTDATHTLFNFPHATALLLDGVGVEGSVLAPGAAVTFTNGSITGTLVGASLTGSGQASLAPFEGCLPRRSATGDQP